MRTVAALSFALAALVGASSAHAVTARGAKPVIVAAVKSSPKVMDKSGPFKTTLGGKSSDTVRPFSASNVRVITIPGNAPAGAQGGARMNVGGVASGEINMKTDKVVVASYIMVR